MTERHAFEVVSTKDIHIGKVVGLRMDEVRMPGGGTAMREVVEHLGAVAVVALDDEDKVVLIHQYRHPVGRRLWELPAGLLDVSGEDAVTTAARELEEEVDLAADQWGVLVDVAASPGFTDEVVRVFLARGLTKANRVEPEGDEEADIVVERVPLAEAVAKVFTGEIINASTVAGLLAAYAVRNGHAGLRPADAPWDDKPVAFAGRRK
ncbi:NUDIX domain-containing protein [Kibdelosporangium phytohabitans]|uniref:ADP-ribose pyrophosphatase n=1 Tax=Kibdelosporangium phytohabitans TaxID=860235 RepID=A0A0N9I0Y3_9PSEU|nr:NUDIX hydrolase [Kibdelosporangium phytohabitans]ALG08123.1 ADP-ribose pyrophosphatase [Kibdelosporangium phytohabitans]MBE1470895.1 ADP-ribose pyrophosphatase [Kibdelosporangium phytohabitans]